MLLRQNSASLVFFSNFYKNSFGFGRIIAIVVVGLLLGILLIGIKFNPFIYKQQALLVLVLEDGKQNRMFEGEVTEGMTVLQALVASSVAGQIKLDYDIDSGGGIIVKALNGYADMENKKPSFYLNNAKINSEDIGRTLIKGGDRIEIRPG